MLREQTISERTDEPYSELGKTLDALARKGNVRGPYSMAKRVTNTTGYRVSGQAVSGHLYGARYPRPSFMSAFAQAFELNIEERDKLARIYTYGELKDERQSL